MSLVGLCGTMQLISAIATAQTSANTIAAIALVPGIFGSKISVCSSIADRDDQCRVAWDPSTNTADTELLPFDPASYDETKVRTRALHDTTYLKVYGALKSLVDQYSAILKYWEFSYDWRRSSSTNATKLKDFLCGIAAAGHKKIYIIAHSMGGLVTRSWLHQNQPLACGGEAEDIDLASIAFVATPHYGATETIKAARDGKYLSSGLLSNFDNLSPALNNSVHGYPSVYELLPLYNNIKCEHGIPSRLFETGVQVTLPNRSEERPNVFSSEFWKTHDVFRKWGNQEMRRSYYDSDAFKRHLVGAERSTCELSLREISERPSQRNPWRHRLRQKEADGAPAVKYIYGDLGRLQNPGWLVTEPATVGRIDFRSGQVEPIYRPTIGDGTVDDFSASHELRNSRLNGDKIRVPGDAGEHLAIMRSSQLFSLVQLWRDDFHKIAAPPRPPQKRTYNHRLPDGQVLAVEYVALNSSPANWTSEVAEQANTANKISLANIPTSLLQEIIESIADGESTYDDLNFGVAAMQARPLGNREANLFIYQFGLKYSELGMFRIGAKLLDYADSRIQTASLKSELPQEMMLLQAYVNIHILRMVMSEQIGIDDLDRPEFFRGFDNAPLKAALGALSEDSRGDIWNRIMIKASSVEFTRSYSAHDWIRDKILNDGRNIVRRLLEEPRSDRADNVAAERRSAN